MKLEQRYIVFKVKDVKALMDPHEISQLNHLCDLMSKRRNAVGKAPLDCLCIDVDWPEYAVALHALEARVDAPGEGVPPAMMAVHADALRDVIVALTSGGELTRFLQLTREESILGNKNNPIDRLIADFNAQVTKWVR